MKFKVKFSFSASSCVFTSGLNIFDKFICRNVKEKRVRNCSISRYVKKIDVPIDQTTFQLLSITGTTLDLSQIEQFTDVAIGRLTDIMKNSV